MLKAGGRCWTWQGFIADFAALWFAIGEHVVHYYLDCSDRLHRSKAMAAESFVRNSAVFPVEKCAVDIVREHTKFWEVGWGGFWIWFSNLMAAKKWPEVAVRNALMFM